MENKIISVCIMIAFIFSLAFIQAEIGTIGGIKPMPQPIGIAKEITIDSSLKDIANNYDIRIKTFEGKATTKYIIYEGKRELSSGIISHKECSINKKKRVCIDLKEKDIEDKIDLKVKEFVEAKARIDKGKEDKPAKENLLIKLYELVFK